MTSINHGETAICLRTLYNDLVSTLIEQLQLRNQDLSIAEVSGILFILVNQATTTNNELVRFTGLPKETLKKFKNTLTTFLDDSNEDLVTFTQEGRTQIAAAKPQPYAWSLKEYSNPALEEKIEAIRKEMNATAERSFDQFYATSKTTVSKVMLLNDKGQITNKRIAVLGDDDLVSICLGLADDTYNSITVFEIDVNLIEKLKHIVEKYDLKNIKFEQYDVRKELKSTFVGTFDVVITDPPYTKSGIKLFLNRAVELIDKKSTEGAIFLYYGNSFKSPEKWIKIQEIITSFGLVIEDKINKFSKYFGAESIGSTSSVYVLRPTKATASKPEIALSTQIYTFEDTKEEKFPFVDHVVVKVFKVSTTILNSKRVLLSKLQDLCTSHKLKVVDTKITSFSPKGLSITYILSNSNLVIHTWPEFNALHIDLVTCAPIYNKEALSKTISDLFGTKYIEISFVE